MFALGSLQGFYGWYLVSSGLNDNPHVSHYRLAGHLLLAFVLMSYILWTILDVNRNHFPMGTNYNLKKLRPALNFIIALIFLQIIYGAFTAGLKAGYGWNTFPKMAGRWIPDGLITLSPWWLNLVEHNVTVQFIHRLLGWSLFMMITGFWRYSRGFNLTIKQDQAITLLLCIIIVQFGLGIFTLIMTVPILLGILHQAGAFLLLAYAIYIYFLINHTKDRNSYGKILF